MQFPTNDYTTKRGLYWIKLTGFEHYHAGEFSGYSGIPVKSHVFVNGWYGLLVARASKRRTMQSRPTSSFLDTLSSARRDWWKTCSLLPHTFDYFQCHATYLPPLCGSPYINGTRVLPPMLSALSFRFLSTEILYKRTQTSYMLDVIMCHYVLYILRQRTTHCRWPFRRVWLILDPCYKVDLALTC